MSGRFLLEDECLGFPFPQLPYSTLIKAEPQPPALPAPRVSPHPPCVPPRVSPIPRVCPPMCPHFNVSPQVPHMHSSTCE